MNFLIIISIFALVLFALAFLTKRRFGALGLALGAGSLLSALWVGDLTPIIEQSGVVLVAPPLSAVVAASITLLPAIILLISGPKYKGGIHRIVGSAAFAILAVTLLINSFGSALIIEGAGKSVYDIIVSNKNLIVTAGLIYAIFDLLGTKSHKPVVEKGKH